jgi:hypothetical protein
VAACALTCVGGARSGVVTPPPVDSGGPAWLDAHHILLSTTYPPGFTWTSHLAVVADDGSGLRPAAAGEAAPRLDETRAVSPDGSQVAFVDDSSGDASRYRIYVTRADGTRRRFVHYGIGVEWLSAHELVVETNGEDGQLLRVRDDGRRMRTIVDDVIFDFALSPDGSEVAFATREGFAYDESTVMWVADTGGRDLDVRRLTPAPCTLEATPRSLSGGCLDGTDGSDRLIGTTRGEEILAGPGADAIRAGDGENYVLGQWGDDDIRTRSGLDFVGGGAGGDRISTGAGADWITPGPGRDVTNAGSGEDHIFAVDGERDVIDCGPADDYVVADPSDVLRNCEHVTRSATRRS